MDGRSLFIHLGGVQILAAHNKFASATTNHFMFYKQTYILNFPNIYLVKQEEMRWNLIAFNTPKDSK